jgi:hypothetical protein
VCVCVRERERERERENLILGGLQIQIWQDEVAFEELRGVAQVLVAPSTRNSCICNDARDTKA